MGETVKNSAEIKQPRLKPVLTRFGSSLSMQRGEKIFHAIWSRQRRSKWQIGVISVFYILEGAQRGLRAVQKGWLLWALERQHH